MRPRVVLLLALLLALPALAHAQGITQQQADEILKELRQIRQLLERQPPTAPVPRAAAPAPPERVRLAPADVYALGREDAPRTRGFTR